MIKFPESIRIDRCDKSFQFKIVEIHSSVYAIKHDIHIMRNEDDMTFGYIVYKDNFIYAYVVSPTIHEIPIDGANKFDFHVVYSSFVGPESDFIMDEEFIKNIIEIIARTYAQYESTTNIHPSVLDSERFQLAHDALKESVDTLGGDYVTAYITPLYNTAIHLRDFYVAMVEDLEAMQRCNK